MFRTCFIVSLFFLCFLFVRHFRKGVNPCSSSNSYCGVSTTLLPLLADGGNAIGVYQIWESYWKDATEFSNLGGKYRDCFVPEYADRVVLLHETIRNTTTTRTRSNNAGHCTNS